MEFDGSVTILFEAGSMWYRVSGVYLPYLPQGNDPNHFTGGLNI